jgi:hypothetical protein
MPAYCPACHAMVNRGWAQCLVCHHTLHASTPAVAVIDTAQTAPDALQVVTGADGIRYVVHLYKCPHCGHTTWGPQVDNPDLWWCLTCHGEAMAVVTISQGLEREGIER